MCRSALIPDSSDDITHDRIAVCGAHSIVWHLETKPLCWLANGSQRKTQPLCNLIAAVAVREKGVDWASATCWSAVTTAERNQAFNWSLMYSPLTGSTSLTYVMYLDTSPHWEIMISLAKHCSMLVFNYIWRSELSGRILSKPFSELDPTNVSESDYPVNIIGDKLGTPRRFDCWIRKAAAPQIVNWEFVDAKHMTYW